MSYKKFVAAMSFMCLGIITTINAQTLNIASCVIQDIDNIAMNKPKFDLNNNIASVVVFTGVDNRDLDFRGNIIGEVIKEDNRYIVYLAEKTKRLHIYCSGCLPTEIDFTEFSASEKGVLGGKTYCISLVMPKQNKDYGVGSNVLVFESNTPLKNVIVNGEEWHFNGTMSKRLVPFGEYHYEIHSDTNEIITGYIEVTESFGNQVVKLNFKS